MALLFLLLFAAKAHAAAPLTLTWDAPAGCPTASDVRAEYERLVRSSTGRALPALTVDAHLEPRGARWVLQLRTVRDGIPGERELEADSCASLGRAAALVMALALGIELEERDAAAVAPRPVEEPRPRTPPKPRAVEAPPPPAPEPPPPPPPEPEPVVAAPVVVAEPPPPPPAEPLGWDVAVEGRASNGPFAPPVFGVGAGVDVGRGLWLASLRLEAWLPGDETTASPDVRARYSGLGASLSACGLTVRTPRVRVAACLGARGAALRGASVGAPIDGSAVAPWYAATPALRVRVRVWGRLHADARAELAVSLNSPFFRVTNLTDVHVPRLAPAGIFGLSADF